MDVEEYFAYASDEDERDRIVQSTQKLEVLMSAASTLQIDTIQRDVTKLEKMIKDMSMAMNKSDCL